MTILAEAGMRCTYLLLPALGSVIEEVSIVLFGAHSVQSDGTVYSRAGTAVVAMMAKAHSVPTLVCCETYKFSDAVHLDSFNKNEHGGQFIWSAHSFRVNSRNAQLIYLHGSLRFQHHIIVTGWRCAMNRISRF